MRSEDCLQILNEVNSFFFYPYQKEAVCYLQFFLWQGFSLPLFISIVHFTPLLLCNNLLLFPFCFSCFLLLYLSLCPSFFLEKAGHFSHSSLFRASSRKMEGCTLNVISSFQFCLAVFINVHHPQVPFSSLHQQFYFPLPFKKIKHFSLASFRMLEA